MKNNNLIMAKEEERLKYTLKVIDEELETNKQSLTNLYKDFSSRSRDPYLLENLSKIYAEKIYKLEKAKDKPYFARIDFKEKGNEDAKKIYIGKSNIMQDSEMVVVDWRAPVSSLYYDGRLGNVSYEAPIGKIEGELLLKRIYEIAKGKLESVSDIDITANDELLKPYLSTTSDTRLKNIISTIQTEQNKIIRASLHKPLIVQGVAGSGKTTVALHRIAYLAYAYEKQLKSDDFMIIAPNKFFLDYISTILPDLGVNDVEQLTFEEFAQKVINSGIKIENSNDKLSNIVNEGRTKDEEDIVQRIATFKSSFEFKEMIDRYLENIEENYLPDEDLSVGGFTILSRENLVSNFKNCSMRKISFEERVKIFKSRLTKLFENDEDKLYNFLSAKRRKELDQLDKSLPPDEYKRLKFEIFDKYDPDFELIKDKGKKIVANYLKKVKKNNALYYYKDFISKLDLYNDSNSETDQEVIKKIKENLLSKKNNKEVEYEDLAPLMYIAQKIKGTDKEIAKNGKMPKHIVIDEAQDYSPFQFFVLKEILNNNSMTILGDIAQGIYSYRGTKDWEEVNEKVFNNNAEIIGLTKSYRTTMEIMNKGNDVISNIKDKINVELGEPVIRKGIPVSITKHKNYTSEISDIVTRLQELTESDNKNIALITKTLQQAKKLTKDLEKNGIQSNLLSEKDVEYKGGISVIPSYLTKGLEFDSVIITDASVDEYGVNELDAKLLYIAITRAMHTLDIYHTGELSPLLRERTKTDKDSPNDQSILKEEYER